MTPTLKKLTCLLLLLPFFFCSCSKKEIEEIEVEAAPNYSWKASSNFLYKNKIQMSSYAAESEFYMLGFEALSKVHYKGEVEHVTSYVHALKSPLEYKFPLTGDVYAGASHNAVSFTSTKNPVSGSGIVTVGMADIDPAFARFDFRTHETGECFGLTKNNVALIPYRVYDTESYSTPVISGSKLLLVKIGLAGSANDIPTVSGTKVIDNMRNDEVKYIQAFDSYFYVAFREGKFVRVSEDGAVEELAVNRLFPMFRHAGAFYGFSYDGLHKSVNGKDWSLLSGMTANATLNDLQMLNYYTLSNGLLIATYNSQMFNVELSEKNLQLKELDKSGLDGNKITSIARFRHKVYLTTLSGVFYRDEDKFLTYKQE